MSRRRYISDAEAYVVLTLIIAAIVGLPVLALYAADWDWRCLFLECRVQK